MLPSQEPEGPIRSRRHQLEVIGRERRERDLAGQGHPCGAAVAEGDPERPVGTRGDVGRLAHLGMGADERLRDRSVEGEAPDGRVSGRGVPDRAVGADAEVSRLGVEVVSRIPREGVFAEGPGERETADAIVAELGEPESAVGPGHDSGGDGAARNGELGLSPIHPDAEELVGSGFRHPDGPVRARRYTDRVAAGRQGVLLPRLSNAGKATQQGQERKAFQDPRNEFRQESTLQTRSRGPVFKPRLRSSCFDYSGSRWRGLRAYSPLCWMSFATSPVQPVWWLAPRPAPTSPWKYS